MKQQEYKTDTLPINSMGLTSLRADRTPTPVKAAVVKHLEEADSHKTTESTARPDQSSSERSPPIREVDIISGMQKHRSFFLRCFYRRLGFPKTEEISQRAAFNFFNS